VNSLAPVKVIRLAKLHFIRNVVEKCCLEILYVKRGGGELPLLKKIQQQLSKKK